MCFDWCFCHFRFFGLEHHFGAICLMCTLLPICVAMCMYMFGHVQVYRRSEEHTSELQSLMRSSYAVFCLKKKTKNYNLLLTTLRRQHQTLRSHIHNIDVHIPL